MQSNHLSLDPLADYLGPEFGDVYSEWTPELRSATKHYLLHEISYDEYAAFLHELADDAPKGSREDQVEFITNHKQPFDLVDASHRAAVQAIPDLQMLIDTLLRHDINNGYEEVMDWLFSHATYEERVALYQYFDPTVVVPPHDGDWWRLEFGYWLSEEAHSLEAVAQAWQAVTNPATPAKAPTRNAAKIRQWAAEHGRWVGARGRIPAEIIEEYQEARPTNVD